MALRNITSCLRSMRLAPAVTETFSNSQPFRPKVLFAHGTVRGIACSSAARNGQCTGSFCLLPQRRLKPKPSGLRYISHSSPICKIFEVSNNDDFMEKVSIFIISLQKWYVYVILRSILCETFLNF